MFDGPVLVGSRERSKEGLRNERIDDLQRFFDDLAILKILGV
jgi:hypothetical protein